MRPRRGGGGGRRPWLADLDPRIRIALVALMTVSSFVFKAPATSAAAFCLAASLLFFSGFRLRALVYVVLYCSPTLINLYILNTNKSNIIIFIYYTFIYSFEKILFFCISGEFLIRNLKISHLLSSIKFTKFNKDIIIIISVVTRFIPALYEDIISLRENSKLCGINNPIITLLIHPATFIKLFIFPIIFKTIKLTDEITAYSLCRGIDSSNNTKLYDLNIKFKDYIILIIYIIILIFIHHAKIDILL